MIATTDDASDRVLQIDLPIIPKHVWGKETHKTIGDAKFDAAAASAPGSTRPSTGRPASSSGSRATRTTGARALCR